MTPKSTRSLERGFVRVSRSDIGLDQGLAWLSRACAIKQEQFCVQECSVRHYACSVRPNVRVKPPAEAGSVSLVRDDAPCAADQAYAACRSGSA
jgi:hypothetical protein